MRGRVMIPAHRRNRDTVVVFTVSAPNGNSSWTGFLIAFKTQLGEENIN